MKLAKYALILVAGTAPFASIGSLIGTFFGLGGWGWLLFLWFGFTGMFAAGAVQMEASPLVLLMALVLAACLVGGAAFAVSDLPRQLPWLYGIAVIGALFILGRAARPRRAE